MKFYYILNENNTIRSIFNEETERAHGFIESEKKPLFFRNFSKIIDGVFYLRKNEHTEYNRLKREKKQILDWLFDNDWKINKIVIGEWKTDDIRWINYLSERSNKRNRLDEIENNIKNYEL